MSYEIRELDIGSILDTAIILFRDHFKVLIGIALIVVTPVSFLANVMAEAMAGGTNTVVEPGAEPSPEEIIGLIFMNQLPWALSFFVILVLGMIAGSLAQGAAIYSVANRYLGRPASLGASLRVGLRRLPALFLGNFLLGIAAGIGTMLCIIPGIVVTVLFYLFPPVMILENVGPLEAMSRSPRLVSGYAWQTFALMCVVGLIGGGAGMLGAIIPSAWAAHSITAIVQGGLSVFTAVVVTVLYFSARCRIENLDLDLLVNEVDPAVIAESRL